jgi:hypothetical protein
MFCCICGMEAIAQTYQWVDENGKKHYSDKRPKQHAVKIKKIKPVQAISIQPVAFKRIKLSKSRPNKNSNKTAASKCQHIKARIARLEKALRMRQAASDFDIQNKQLTALRWQKRKTC